MLGLLLFFIPPGFALKWKDRLFQQKRDLREYIFTYFKYTLFINLVSFLVLFIYSIGTEVSLRYCMYRISFVFKYLLMSLVIALLLPVAEEYIRKNTKFKLTFKKDKNEKKNTK